jgi:Flp pilus assembly protein TadB
MSSPAWLTVVATCAATALLVPGRTSLDPPVTGAKDRPDRDWLRRWRPLWVLLAGAAAAAFLGGPVGLAAAPVAAATTWLVIERSEPTQLRRMRDRARGDLPHVVGLLADALRSGQPPDDALGLVAGALPGPAAARLAEVVPRLRLGVDPGLVWADLAADPALGPLGRALARAHRTGAPVVPAIERLADELTRSARAEVEDRARAVGVKAAVPLGLCLLPAFILVGIVPVVAGLLTSLGI